MALPPSHRRPAARIRPATGDATRTPATTAQRAVVCQVETIIPPVRRAKASWLSGAMGVVLLAAALALGACSFRQMGEITYAEGAQASYEEAVVQLEDKNYEQAIMAFQQVRARYPYSSYAALAELRIADADFGRSRWLEAIDGYQAFLKFHPAHPDVDWAAYRIGASHFNAIPSSFFLFPPASERDQTEVRAARTSLQDFISRYPESSHLSQAKTELARVMELLVKHELYTAEFYASRERWAGAAGRYEFVLQNYPGSGFDGQATVGLAEALLQQDEGERAAALLDRFLAGNPGGKEGEKARKLRASLPVSPR